MRTCRLGGFTGIPLVSYTTLSLHPVTWSVYFVFENDNMYIVFIKQILMLSQVCRVTSFNAKSRKYCSKFCLWVHTVESWML